MQQMDQYSREYRQSYEVNMIITVFQREAISSLPIGFYVRIVNMSVCVYKYACDKSF